MIKVYTKDACVQCDRTKKMLDKEGLEYEEVDITEPENLSFVKGLGYMQAPVVVTDDDNWSGFRYEKIKGLV